MYVCVYNLVKKTNLVSFYALVFLTIMTRESYMIIIENFVFIGFRYLSNSRGLM